MKFSTRGRYTLRMLSDIAIHQENDVFVSLLEISRRQNISFKYLERLIPPLVKGGYLESAKGREGGYRLKKKPEDISIDKILTITDSLVPVACLKGNPEECGHYQVCTTVGMWKAFQQNMHAFFAQYTIRDLIDGRLALPGQTLTEEQES